jgi:hypothetical protein
METTTVFKPTAIQKKALALLNSGAKHILLFDGLRSGKNAIFSNVQQGAHTGMKPFLFFRKHNKTTDNRPELDGIGENLPFPDHFSNFNFTGEPRSGDSYLCNAWVNSAVTILIRNIARADFTIKKRGEDVTSSPDYAGGLPKELYVLNPRGLRHEEHEGWEMSGGLAHKRQGALKIEQTLRPAEASRLERRWESKRGAANTARKIAEINAGLKTINNGALKERGKDTKPWGNARHRPKNMLAASGNEDNTP